MGNFLPVQTLINILDFGELVNWTIDIQITHKRNEMKLRHALKKRIVRPVDKQANNYIRERETTKMFSVLLENMISFLFSKIKNFRN